MFRYIDDVLSLNDCKFGDMADRICLMELETKDTTDKARSASYLDLRLEILLYDKRDDFNVPIWTFHCYEATFQQYLHMHQLILYSRGYGSYHDFPDIGLFLTRKLLNHGFLVVKLMSSLRHFYGRDHDLVNGVSLHKWLRICSVCRNHNPTLFSFLTNHRVCNKSSTMGATFWAGTFVFYVIFCRSLFVPLSFFFLSMCGLFFDLQLMDTSLVSICKLFLAMQRYILIFNIGSSQQKYFKELCFFHSYSVKNNQDNQIPAVWHMMLYHGTIILYSPC